eukprot:9958717-Ditylum_brightwellii.AAC.1
MDTGSTVIDENSNLVSSRKGDINKDIAKRHEFIAIKLDMEHSVSSGTLRGEVNVDWSYAPQFTSQKVLAESSGKGILMNEERVVNDTEEYAMKQLIVVMR